MRCRRISRYILMLLLPGLLLLLQSTVLSPYRIQGVVPDIILVVVICFAMFNRRGNSVAYGIFCGLLEDLFVARIIGINTIAKGLAAYIIVTLQPRLFQDNVVVGLITVIIGTIFNLLVSFILLYLTAGDFHMHYNIAEYGLYQILYNAIFAIPTYYLFYRFNR